MRWVPTGVDGGFDSEPSLRSQVVGNVNSLAIWQIRNPDFFTASAGFRLINGILGQWDFRPGHRCVPNATDTPDYSALDWLKFESIVRLPPDLDRRQVNYVHDEMPPLRPDGH